MGTGPSIVCSIALGSAGSASPKFSGRAGGVYKAGLTGAVLTPVDNPLLILQKLYLHLLT
jgi:hypothetical protein